MADPTVKDQLDKANPNVLADLCRKIALGTMLATKPAALARSGLTSSATQVHPYAAVILSVDDGAAGPLAIISSGSPGSGEVMVAYSAAGVPTLTFSGAVTAYSVIEVNLSAAWTKLAETWPGAV